MYTLNTAPLAGIPLGLKPRLSPDAQVISGGQAIWRLTIPPGSSQHYRLAQLDDYDALPRRAFSWEPPLSFALQARASARVIPGTWGFGLWNDPFGMGLLGGTNVLGLPALPNTAWFFFASPQNY